MPWMAGKVLGGGSSVNGMVWVRGNRADFDEWASLGCEGWDYESVLPYFKRAERYRGGADDYRGGGGPQRVQAQGVSHPLNDAFERSRTKARAPSQRRLQRRIPARCRHVPGRTVARRSPQRSSRLPRVGLAAART